MTTPKPTRKYTAVGAAVWLTIAAAPVTVVTTQNTTPPTQESK